MELIALSAKSNQLWLWLLVERHRKTKNLKCYDDLGNNNDGESGSWKLIFIYHPVAIGIDAKEEMVGARIAAESLIECMDDESVKE